MRSPDRKVLKWCVFVRAPPRKRFVAFLRSPLTVEIHSAQRPVWKKGWRTKRLRIQLLHCSQHILESLIRAKNTSIDLNAEDVRIQSTDSSEISMPFQPYTVPEPGSSTRSIQTRSIYKAKPCILWLFSQIFSKLYESPPDSISDVIINVLSIPFNLLYIHDNFATTRARW